MCRDHMDHGSLSDGSRVVVTWYIVIWVTGHVRVVTLVIYHCHMGHVHVGHTVTSYGSQVMITRSHGLCSHGHLGHGQMGLVSWKYGSWSH